jgi:protein ImuB
MRRREAQECCPDLHVATDNPDRDHVMFEPIVRAVADIAPLIEVGEPGMIVFPTRGPSRYMGGDDALGARVVAVLEAAFDQLALHDTTFGVGIADGRLMATIAAHAGRSPCVVAVDTSRTQLAECSVAVLANHAGVGRDVVSLLQRLGIATLGDLAALPAATLSARFGPVGAQMHRLARGEDRHPPVVIPPPPDHATMRRFEDPIEDLHVVAANGRVVAEELCAHLADHGAVCVRLHVSLWSDHGEHHDRVWYQPEGLGAAAIAERIRWQMEGWVGSLTSGLVLMRLIPLDLRPFEGRQVGLWGAASAADEAAQRATTALVQLLGAGAVRVPEWRGGRDPMEVFARTAASLVDFEQRAVAVRQERQWRGALPSPFPTRVYDEPVAIEILGIDGARITVSGRHELSAAPFRVIVDRVAHDVTWWAGPWPVEECWWDQHRRRRAVRMHVVASARAMVAVLERGTWSIAGEFL